MKVDSLLSKKDTSNDVPRVDDVETTVVATDHKLPWWKSLFTRSVSEDVFEDQQRDDYSDNYADDVQEEVDQEGYAPKKRGFFSWLFGSNKPVEEDIDSEVLSSTVQEESEHEKLIDQTRTVLKDLHKWLSKLPPEQVDAFKRSPDFERYKELLDKYGLIR